MIFIALGGSTSGGYGYPQPQIQGIERRVDARCPYCFEGIKGQSNLSSCPHCAAFQHNACWREALNQCATCKRVKSGVPAPIQNLQKELSSARYNQVRLTIGVALLLFSGGQAFAYDWLFSLVPFVAVLFLYLLARTCHRDENEAQGQLVDLQQRHEELLSQRNEEQPEEAPCGRHHKKELA